ncbi:MAG TPA: heparan-alpha-glucosaminide N-acetyltransferase domain-containing protein [Pseudobacteroides sp.]|uniref:heparan-alpha-glucosaminide N-acetyltransferase domain-containing protein n=1 Tax=Pseudobacteroides sp. TaxID=1968840 RepID=UPI002F92AD25
MRVLDNILSKHPVNTKRQIEVDIARGLAVFFMILVHVTGDLSSSAVGDTLFGKTVDFFGTIPAAPVFMFLMGVGFVYSRSQRPFNLFKRGIMIFACGYILNFFRGFLPLFIGSKMGYYDLNVDGTPWYYFLIEGDILHFAGIAMMFTALLKKLKIKEFFYPLIAIIIAAVTPLVGGFSTGIGFLDTFLMTIFGRYGYVFHPFFSWMVYPLMGSFFGWMLIRTENKNKFYTKAVFTSFFIGVPALIYYMAHSDIDLGIVVGDINNYFQHGILSNLLFVPFVVIWLSIWYMAASIIPEVVKGKLLFWSKAVTAVYVVHWLIVGWAEFLFIEELSLANTIIAMFIVVFFTNHITDLYIKIKDRISERNDPALNPHLN